MNVLFGALNEDICCDSTRSCSQLNDFALHKSVNEKDTKFVIRMNMNSIFRYLCHKSHFTDRSCNHQRFIRLCFHVQILRVHDVNHFYNGIGSIQMKMNTFPSISSFSQIFIFFFFHRNSCRGTAVVTSFRHSNI